MNDPFNLHRHTVVVQSLCPIPGDPMNCSTPGFPVLHHLPEFAQTHVHWVVDAIQPSYSPSSLSPLFSIFPSIRVFSSESALCIKYPKYWSFSFSINPSSEYSGLITFRAIQDGWVMVESSNKMWSTGEGNGKPLQHSCLENPMNSMKRQKDMTGTLVSIYYFLPFYRGGTWGIEILQNMLRDSTRQQCSQDEKPDSDSKRLPCDHPTPPLCYAAPGKGQGGMCVCLLLLLN